MIGIAVMNLLKASTSLAALVGSKIYPYAIEEDTTLPGVVYKVSSSVPEYDKSGLVQEEHQIEVLSYALTYSNCLNVSKEVRAALELKKGEIEGITIKSCKVVKTEEAYDFEQDVYFSKINFEIITQ